MKIKNNQISIFISEKNKEFKKNEKDYKQHNQIIFQKNFLIWLLKTFKISKNKLNEQKFKSLKVKKNMKLLLLGCGLGDEIIYLHNKYKKMKIRFYYQDISKVMTEYAFKNISKKKINCKYIVSGSDKLPFEKDFFDGIFHFGGINLFKNPKSSLNEMMRVTKDKGQIIYGDEGIGTWLRKSTYSKMLINNNKLWSSKPLLEILPFKSRNIKLSWILENCFYVISFFKNKNFPNINLKVKHKSPRGGSIYSRYKR